MFMILSQKAKSNLLIIFDELKLETPKTKFLAGLIESWKLKIENFKDGSCLLALPAMDKNIILSTRNLPKIETVQAKDLNVLDLLNSKYLLMPKDSIKVVQETFAK